MESSSKTNRLQGMTVLSFLVGPMGVIALLVLSLINEYQDSKQHARGEVENFARLLDEHALATVRKADLLLREVQRVVRPEDMRPAIGVSGSRKQELHALLKSQVESVPEAEVIHVTDALGNHRYSSLDPVPPINIADRYHFTRHRDDPAAGLVIPPPLVSRTTGKWTIVLARRLNFEDGGFAGTVNVILDLNYFESFYRTLNLGSQGLVALYDKELHLAARFPPRVKDMGKISMLYARNFIEKGINNATYQAKSPLDGIARIYSFREVGDLPLIVFAGIADDDYLAEWYRHIWQYGAGAAIFFLLVIVFWLRLQGMWKGQSLLAAIVETSDDAIISNTLDGIVTSWNGSAERLLGYTAAEAIGKPMNMIFPPDRKDEERYLLDRIALGENVYRFETERIRKDGSIVHVSVNLSPIKDKFGRIVGTSKIAHDITERKRAEEKFQEAARYTRSLIEASLDPLVTIGGDGKILDVNSATEKVTGVSRDKLIGSDFSDYFSEPEKARVGYRQVFANNSVTDYPLTIRHVSGKLTDVLYNAVVYRNEQGEVAGIFAAARDITARKQAEVRIVAANRQLAEQARKLEAVNAELTQFAYVASHDLRAPLRLVISYLDLIVMELGPDLNDNLKEFIATAVDGAKRMDAMILGLLEYSRTGRGGKPFEILPLADVVSESLLNLQVAIQESGAKVLVAEGFPAIPGERLELTRLFQNLIGNAVKYHPPGRTPVVEVGWRDDGEAWGIWVKDNGIGIESKDCERIFGVFQRLVTNEEYEGSGIGLAVCKKITEHHGGRIWVESVLGEGSTFHVAFPKTAPM